MWLTYTYSQRARAVNQDKVFQEEIRMGDPVGLIVTKPVPEAFQIPSSDWSEGFFLPIRCGVLRISSALVLFRSCNLFYCSELAAPESPKMAET